MKTFFSTLFAILAAAAIIWFVASVHHAGEHAARQREEIRQITLDTELHSAQSEWEAQISKNPRFDPNGDKLVARLREIREASEAGKPIPPSPWK